MKIFLADDHPMFRTALQHILAAEFPGAEFGEAGTAAAAVAGVQDGNWSVMILDVNLPGRSGLDVLAELCRSQPKLPILVLSGESEDQFAVRALKAGAMGYLTKDSSSDELVKAVKQAVAGRRYVSPVVAQKLAATVAADPAQPVHETLSNREFLVLRLMSAGKSSKEIAAELSLSVKTVSTYRARMLGKMQMKSNAELIRYAIEHHLAG
jgi:DNA-binding NarL/FixJ family response regulator